MINKEANNNMTKEQERTELHRAIWKIANDLRGSVDGWDFKTYVLGMLFYRFISESGVNIPQLTVPNVKKIKIPIPSLSEQDRIVSILDQFDRLINDISIGLPAELSARRSQYEYYRNKLLTFKERSVADQSNPVERVFKENV